MIDVSSDPQRMRDYVGGRLSDEEHRKFEDRLARDPELVREIELFLRMRVGLERLRARRGHDALVASGTGQEWRWAVAVAASLVAAVAVWWSLQSGVPARSVLLAALDGTAGARQSPARVTAEFTLVNGRGSSAVPTFGLPANGVIALRMEPASRATAIGNRVTLAEIGRANGPLPMGAIAGMRAGRDGLLTCYGDVARLHPGTYELRVTAEDTPDSSPTTYRFRLRPAFR